MSEYILKCMRALMGDEEFDKRLVEWAKKIEADWRGLSDGERVTLIGLCCRHCGTLVVPCYCGPEYDE